MLGELNASHTGARYYGEMKGRGHTASLGVFHDWAYNGPGIRVLEVIERGPLSQLEKPLEAGGIIEKINGREIVAGENHYARLWRLEGERVLLSFHDPKSGERWEEVVRPVGLRKESELTYRRWLARMREETDRLSGGKIGYVHIKGMNDGSFREFYGEVFGRHGHKKALVVDTRFNGGGWLTEDLTAFLSGVDYLRFYPREKAGMGGQPIFRWSKPSAVLMGEGNYSDAHMFPFAYKAMGIGKLVGMPVPGTATAVWWESLMDPELLFGIPQVGMVGQDGSYMENTQLEPDIRVELPPEDGPKLRDRQLEAAVKHLLSLPEPEPWKFPEAGK
jgi:tricorn protease